VDVGQAECDTVAATDAFLKTGQTMHAFRNIEVRSCNYFCSEKHSALHISSVCL